jgi:hypothetical protein
VTRLALRSREENPMAIGAVAIGFRTFHAGQQSLICRAVRPVEPRGLPGCGPGCAVAAGFFSSRRSLLHNISLTRRALAVKPKPRAVEESGI